MVHIRDFVNYLADRRDFALDEKGEKNSLSVASIDFGAQLMDANILRPVLYVPRSMPALDLLCACRRRARIWRW